jgi:hypothetical protein
MDRRGDSLSGAGIRRFAEKGNYNLKGEDELILKAL